MVIIYTIEPDKKISTKCDIQIRLHSVVKIYLDAEKERLVLMNSC